MRSKITVVRRVGDDDEHGVEGEPSHLGRRTVVTMAITPLLRLSDEGRMRPWSHNRRAALHSICGHQPARAAHFAWGGFSWAHRGHLMPPPRTGLSQAGRR